MRRSILISLALLLALGLSSLAITGCGGGGGGGSSAVYSVAGGIWQMTWTDTATGVVGFRYAFRSNGTGYWEVYGLRGPITWSQDGNVLAVAIPGEGTYAVTLEWKGPNEFTWTNVNGGHATYVRVGVVGVEVKQPESSTGGSVNIPRDAGLIGR